VNGRASPLEIDVTPRFGWHLRAAEQTAYDVRAAFTRDVWSSGKVSGEPQGEARLDPLLLGVCAAPPRLVPQAGPPGCVVELLGGAP
jgi:hypothetical protein